MKKEARNKYYEASSVWDPRSSGDITFDKERYLQQHVLDSDNHAVLRIQLETPEDAFSKFSPSHYEELDEALASHIDTLVYPIPLKYPLIFEFQVNCSTMEQEEKLVQVMKTYYCLRRADKVLDLRINMVKTFALFTIGAILLAFSYVLASRAFLKKENRRIFCCNRADERQKALESFVDSEHF